jgi:hypothetical protein
MSFFQLSDLTKNGIILFVLRLEIPYFGKKINNFFEFLK